MKDYIQNYIAELDKSPEKIDPDSIEKIKSILLKAREKDNMKDFIHDYLAELSKCLKEINSDVVGKIREALLKARDDDKKIFVIGNGGSASTASHAVCDWNKGVLGHTGEKNIKRFKVVGLADNIASMTAWANDTCYDDVFAEQLENLMDEGDVVVAISASGNSKNIVKALSVAKKKRGTIIGLAGFTGGKLAEMADICITAKINRYDVAEDVHLIISHILTRWFFENVKA